VYGYRAMKTLTELSGTLIRMASAAIEAARRSLPAEPAPAAPPAPPAEVAAPAEGEAAPAAEASAAPAEGGPGDAVKAALQEAVAKATGLSGDRLGFLCAAVEAVGGRVADVRLVRVFSSEEPVGGAKTVAGHQYLVDMMPSTMKQVAGNPREEGGRRGGRGGRGGGGGGGRGGGGTKAGATGGFSMDSLREDRKNERRGPGGGGRPFGRGPGGGGRGPGGGRGGPPPAGGGPKPG
jgi:hypothetical protein